MDVGTCRVIFWDLGGQVRMRSIWEKYYAEAHGMIFVIDSADVGRMDEANLAFDAVRDHEELRGIPVLLLANKQDLPVRDVETRVPTGGGRQIGRAPSFLISRCTYLPT